MDGRKEGRKQVSVSGRSHVATPAFPIPPAINISISISISTHTYQPYPTSHDPIAPHLFHTAVHTNATPVLGHPLSIHSTRPLTGFLRTGYCEVPKSDPGNHAIAGILTNEFLDFSASRGNDLRSAGLKDGCKWCLCVARWKEAFDARKSDTDRVVPRVVLGATSERALEGVGLEDLRKFSAGEEEKGVSS
jgi:uncharacterized protein (DUF2237 family)